MKNGKKFLAVFISFLIMLFSMIDGAVVFAQGEVSAEDGDVKTFAAELIEMIRDNDKASDSSDSDEDDGNVSIDDLLNMYPGAYVSPLYSTFTLTYEDKKLTLVDGSEVIQVENTDGSTYEVTAQSEATVQGEEVYVPVNAVNQILADDLISALPYGAFDSARLIVKSEKLTDYRGAIDCVSGYRDLYILQYSSPYFAQEAYKYYCGSNEVEYVEPDLIQKMQAEDVLGNLKGEASEYLYDVHDKALSYVSDSIGFEDIADDLAKRVLADVIVAVVDSGVDTDHELLVNRLLPNDINLSDSGDENSVEDDFGHGTHVAGILADNTLSNVKIKPYKVLNSQGKGSSSLIAIAVDLAVADGVDIINLSIAARGESKTLEDSINTAVKKNVNVIVAAGNDRADLSEIYYSPACIESAVTVSATTRADSLSSYSNYNGTIDIAAPGDNVKSSYLNNTYKLMSGTSMATPLVSAGFAIVRSVFTDKSAAEVEEYVKKYAVKVEEVPGENKYGAGILYLKYILDVIPRTAAVKFSVESGTFSESFKLRLSCSEAGATILYVINGEDGVDIGYLNGTKYNEPITISVDTKVSAVAIVKGKMFSEPVTHNYTRSHESIEDNYDIDSKGVVTGYYGNEVNVTVPTVIRGITVKEIGSNAFAKNQRIETVKLPDIVTSIGTSAFEDCTSLNSVEGAGINRINNSAFKNSAITSIPFSQISHIGDSAFSGCSNLENVELSKVLYIGNKAFENAGGITVFNSNTVNYIGENAFANSTVEKVNLPNIVSIGVAAFQGCNGLTEFSAETLATVSQKAFKDCASLKTINIPLATTISNFAFVNTDLEKIDLSNITKVGKYAFQNSKSLKLANFPKATVVDTEAFSKCQSLVAIGLPKAMTVGSSCFIGCDKLKALWLPAIKNLAFNTFNGSSIEFLQVDSAVTIGSLPDSLKKLVLASTVTSIPAITGSTEYTVYGYEGTYAEQYANENGQEFCEVPTVVFDMPEEVNPEEKYLFAFAFGFNCTYQWYKNDTVSNENGVPIDGETNFYYEPKLEDEAVAYYCVIESDDGGIKETFTTSPVKNSDTLQYADYTAYNELLAEIENIDRDLYTDESLSILDNLISVDISNRTLAQQDEIQAHIDDIKNAVSNLVYDYILGDINRDGLISAVDARIVLKAVAYSSGLEKLDFLASDANCDGDVTLVDARIILQAAAGLIELK